MPALAELSILDQLPNGGAVVAIIAVVAIFLKHMATANETMKSIAIAFAAETTAARSEYRQHVTGIMEQGLAAHRETRDAIRSLEATLGEFWKDAGERT